MMMLGAHQPVALLYFNLIIKLYFIIKIRLFIEVIYILNEIWVFTLILLIRLDRAVSSLRLRINGLLKLK